MSRRRSLLARLRTDNRGVAFVEFALIAPVLIAFYFGCVEFCLALMATKRAAHTAASVGDLVSQSQTVTTTQLDDIFRISRTAMTPFSTTSLRVRVTQLRQESATTYSVVTGSSCHKNWSTRVSGTGVPTGVVANGEIIVFAESEYDYASPVDAFMPGLTTFRSRIIFRPRTSTQVTGPGGAAITCPGTTW